MKKIVIAILIAAACVGASPPNAHAINLYGIWWMPDKGDDDGFGGGIKQVRHFTPLIALDGRVSYVSFPDVGVIPVEFTGLVSLGMLYGGLGGGYYFMTGDNDLKDTFGYYILAGIDIGLGGIGVFGEIKWQSLEPDVDVPNGGSVNFDAFAIHVGATLGIK